MLRFRPADAALFEPETCEQAGHANWRADGLHYGNAELILKPVRLYMYGTLADPHWDDHLGALLDEAFCFIDEVLDHLLVVRRQVG